uniref:Embigin n=1 Tax=Chelydra serpentina TaxID=8475 RepID=A0A8C3XVB5_CHESE
MSICNQNLFGYANHYTQKELVKSQKCVIFTVGMGMFSRCSTTAAADGSKDSLNNTQPAQGTVVFAVDFRFSSAPVEENVILYSPANIALSCNLTSPSTDSATVNVTWKKDNETLRSSSVTFNETKHVWSTQYINQMGNYTCVFKRDQEVKATFHLQVPQIEGKEHHVVSYVGDSVVLVCKSIKYIPISWIWYMSNGSDQQLPVSVQWNKYTVDEKYANITKLKILKISEEDDRSYWCQAVFKLGESKGKVSLKVLTYMTPLKPFLAIAAEVIILVAIIFLYEMYSKKKQMHAGTLRQLMGCNLNVISVQRKSSTLSFINCWRFPKLS